MRRSLLLLGLTGCRSLLGIEEPAARDAAESVGPDADVDASDATPLDGCTTFSKLVDTCAIGAFGPALQITSSRVYNTDTRVLSDLGGLNSTTPPFATVTIGGGAVTVLLVDGLTISSGGSLRVLGSRGFGIVSTGAVQIDGSIDATAGGAGARTVACTTSRGVVGATNSGGGSGGGGGGFNTAGARGAKADTNGAVVQGGPGGVAVAFAPSVLGGCNGGAGGSAGGAAGGAGGAGGGAVVTIGASSITISVLATINAGGGGGRAGAAIDAGGGGGGSGGMIVLEAPMVNVAGAIAANGGGGGAGAGNTSGTDGENGHASTIAANGGTASGAGSRGGDGGGRNALPTIPPDAAAGGGGGGGGVGFVSVLGANVTTQGTVSPSPTAWP